MSAPARRHSRQGRFSLSLQFRQLLPCEKPAVEDHGVDAAGIADVVQWIGVEHQVRMGWRRRAAARECRSAWPASPLPAIRVGSAANWASRWSFSPGRRPLSSIRMCTAWSAAGRCNRTGGGKPRSEDFCSPCKPSRSSFAASISMGSRHCADTSSCACLRISPRSVEQPDRRAAAGALGGVRQAAPRRPRAGPRVPRSLHASGSDQQRSACAMRPTSASGPGRGTAARPNRRKSLP